MQRFCSYTSTPPNLSVVFSKFVSCIYLLNNFVVQFLSCVWLFLTATNCSMPGFPVLNQLLELAQTYVHWVGDAIQLSCPLSSPSPPAFSLFQHQSFPVSWLFTCDHSIGVSASVSVLPMFVHGWFPLGLTSLIPLQSQGLWRVSSKTTVQKHQFFGTQLSLLSNSHIHTSLLEKP